MRWCSSTLVRWPALVVGRGNGGVHDVSTAWPKRNDHLDLDRIFSALPPSSVHHPPHAESTAGSAIRHQAVLPGRLTWDRTRRAVPSQSLRRVAALWSNSERAANGHNPGRTRGAEVGLGRVTGPHREFIPRRQIGENRADPKSIFRTRCVRVPTSDKANGPVETRPRLEITVL